MKLSAKNISYKKLFVILVFITLISIYLLNQQKPTRYINNNLGYSVQLPSGFRHESPNALSQCGYDKGTDTFSGSRLPNSIRKLLFPLVSHGLIAITLDYQKISICTYTNMSFNSFYLWQSRLYIEKTGKEHFGSGDKKETDLKIGNESVNWYEQEAFGGQLINIFVEHGQNLYYIRTWFPYEQGSNKQMRKNLMNFLSSLEFVK